MSEKRNWGSTVLGWFVIQGGAEAAEGDAATPASPDDPAAPALAGPDPAATFVEPPPPSRGGQVDFDAVFAAAGIDDEERARVGKAAELLDTLPTATEPAVKQQIVEASLKAFGVPIEKIIEAGVQEIQALQAYIQTGAQDTQKVLEESQRRIAQYEEEVRRIKIVMDQRVQEQQAVMKACNDRKLGIQRVLEFFGQEVVARVVRDSPKLIDPSERKA